MKKAVESSLCMIKTLKKQEDCHSELDSETNVHDLSQSMFMRSIRSKVQSAAMFGLDARIALAIFGALSIITGAALYSTLNKIDTITMLNDLNEMGKAYEQYYIDTGKFLPNNSSDPANVGFYQLRSATLLDGKDRYDNDIHGFKGPYIAYKKGVSNMLYQGSISVYMYPLLMNPSSTQLGNTKSWQDALCTAGKTCGLWIRLDPIPSDDILKKLDQIIDKGDGLTAGDVRWQITSSTRYQLYYNYMPIKNPHN